MCVNVSNTYLSWPLVLALRLRAANDVTLLPFSLLHFYIIQVCQMNRSICKCCTVVRVQPSLILLPIEATCSGLLHLLVHLEDAYEAPKATRTCWVSALSVHGRCLLPFLGLCYAWGDRHRHKRASSAIRLIFGLHPWTDWENGCSELQI